MTVAMLLLSTIGASTSRWTTMGFFVVLGVGMGLLMQITTLVAQNSVDPRDMGVASSSRAFFQQIGGSIGVSIFGVLFTRALISELHTELPGAPLKASNFQQLNPVTVAHLPAQMQHALFGAISHGIESVFIWAAPASVVVFLLAWLVKEIPLRGRADAPGQGGSPEPKQPELLAEAVSG